MEYSTQFLSTPTPVELVEAKEGLSKITTFDELVSFTLRALLGGYGCTEDMLNRLENHSSILHLNLSSIDFFVTYNPHCFAACATNSSRSFSLPCKDVLLEQTEIIDLIPSLPGSFKRPGTHHHIQSINQKTNQIVKRSFYYEPPIFDTVLRYLVCFKHTHTIGTFKQEDYKMVLYIPGH